MRYIYIIVNLNNGKVYVGQSYDPVKRWKGGHLVAARKGIEHPLYRAIRKHGEPRFEVLVIEECRTLELTDEREKFWIRGLRTRDRKHGYNLEEGGQGMSKATRQKLSEALKGNTHCVGRELSPETRKKIGIASRRTAATPDGRARLRKNFPAGQEGKANPMWGRRGANHPSSKLTQEQAREIRELHSAGGETTYTLAERFGVSRFTVSRVIKGQLYGENP